MDRIDLHIHTTASDGTDTPEELLSKVREAGVSVFFVTDHDSVKACAVIRAAVRDGDPLFITGAEFSCRDAAGKYHILGYGFDPGHRAIAGLTERGHALRMKKACARLDGLRSEFGIVFPDGDVSRLLSLDNPGKPHIVNLLIKYGFAATKEQAIKEYVDRLRIVDEQTAPEEAIGAVAEAGGVAVLAHPFFGDGDELIGYGEMEERLRRLTGYGLKGIEAFYSGFDEKLRSAALDLAEKFGLYVTAGSDYHGTNKPVKLADTGLDAYAGLPDGVKRFIKEVTG